jgi:hypothetical protein
MTNKRFLSFTALVLIFSGISYSCSKNNDIDTLNIDFSNIENLYAQQLPVIQKCIQGEWQWINVVYNGVNPGFSLNETFVEIKENIFEIKTIDYDDFLKLHNTPSFSYYWEKTKIRLNSYDSKTITTYVIMDNVQKNNNWWFSRIIDDYLYMEHEHTNEQGRTTYVLKRIK